MVDYLIPYVDALFELYEAEAERRASSTATAESGSSSQAATTSAPSNGLQAAGTAGPPSVSTPVVGNEGTAANDPQQYVWRL